MLNQSKTLDDEVEMKLPLRIVVGVCLSCFYSFGCAGNDTHSGRALSESLKASSHASASAAHSVAASGRVASAATAIPLSMGAAVSGAVSVGSAAAATASLRAATAPIRPLPISDESVTVVRPDEALKQRAVTGNDL